MAENGRRKGDDALLLALASGQTVRAAGIGERTATRRVADPDFRRRVGELRAEMVGWGQSVRDLEPYQDAVGKVLRGELGQLRLVDVLPFGGLVGHLLTAAQFAQL